MKNVAACLLFFLFYFHAVKSHSQQTTPVDTLPVRAFAIAAPQPRIVDSFVTFIQNELAPRKINTLILRVDFDYEYKSRPELRSNAPLSEKDVKKIVAACKTTGITIVPQINLLGHQSWANRTGKLLEVYPQFDETPWVVMPEKYEWPNPQKLYCKSYCPLHPGVHNIIFPMMDELCDVFETNAFHAGMDEVFYIADEKCPRCRGLDPAMLFAGEVTKIRNHLALKGRKLWIWGDRLIDGKTTGMGEWEASMNNTHRAIDLVPKDVMINDWHYERADQTAVYFAMKGFDVISCLYKNQESGLQQLEDMYKFRQRATAALKDRFRGIMQTVWTSAANFLSEYYQKPISTGDSIKSESNAFKTVFPIAP